jgi:hypothetical protein
MIAHKKEFFGGAAMLAVFAIALVLIFSPLIQGKNGLEYLDELYNSISKGSAYYIPKMKEEAKAFEGNSVTVGIKVTDKNLTSQTALLFKAAGAGVDVTQAGLKVTGDLGTILAECIADSDAMYANQGKKISDKYGYGERQVLYNWWKALKEMDKNLTARENYKEAKVVALIGKKAVETAYNYYGIQPQKITDRLGIVIFSLVFYVLYTVWYGFAIMFMFEGWGLRLEH